jgi:hypothetical protein
MADDREFLPYATQSTTPAYWVRRFYGHFAAAYGTCWLVLLALAMVTMSNIQTGLFGLLGFPVISILYAIIRMTRPSTLR